MSLDADDFRSVLGRFASGVTVVTTSVNGEPHGMTVSAFSSVSLEPPLVVICIDKSASLHDQLVAGEMYAVNLLSSHQEALARRFAETGAQRFDGVGYTPGRNDLPIIDDVLAHVVCKRYATFEAGDHTLVVGETLECGVRDARPLLYYRGGFAQLER